MEIVRQISLDVSRANVFAPIDVKQSDEKSRYLDVTITDRGVTKVVPQDATVIINVKRPDGAAKGFSGTVKTDGTLRVPVPAWALQIPGDITCDVSIISGEERLTTMDFTLRAQRAAYTGDDITADDNYDILTELIDKAGSGTGTVTSTAIETALGYKPVNAFYVTVTPASSGDQTTGTADKTDAEIYAAYAAGSAVFCRVASEGHFFGHPATLPIFAAVKDGDNYMFAFCGSGAPRSGTGDAAVTVTVTRNQHNWYVFYDTLAKKTDIPTALKSPNALTLKLGGTTVVYDGSAAKTFEIPDGTEVSY